MATYESRKYGIIPINANQIADNSIDNSEFQQLNNVSSNIQTQINSKLTAAGAFTIATGMILPWAAPLADKPTGYLNCDGSNVSRSTYSALFAIIATTYGVGNGSTTFGLPNFQNRMAIGKSGTYSLGATGGSTTESYTPVGSVSTTVNSHTLTLAEIPSHSHFIVSNTKTTSNGVGVPTGAHATYGNNGGMGSSDYALQGSSTTPNVLSTNTQGSSGSHNHGSSSSFSGSSATLDILNPYISINFIIKT